MPSRCDDVGFFWVEEVGESDPELGCNAPVTLSSSLTMPIVIASLGRPLSTIDMTLFFGGAKNQGADSWGFL